MCYINVRYLLYLLTLVVISFIKCIIIHCGRGMTVDSIRTWSRIFGQNLQTDADTKFWNPHISGGDMRVDLLSRPVCGGGSSRLVAGEEGGTLCCWSIDPTATDDGKMLMAQHADTWAQKATYCSGGLIPQPPKWWFETQSITRELKYSNREKILEK